MKSDGICVEDDLDLSLDWRQFGLILYGLVVEFRKSNLVDFDVVVLFFLVLQVVGVCDLVADEMDFF